MKKTLLIIALAGVCVAGCATKGGWPCWAWQSNTDQKNERAGEQYLRTNQPPQNPKP